MNKCPQRTKTHYLTLADAATAAVNLLTAYGPQRAYRCGCGGYCLTTKPLYLNKPLTEAMVRQLQAVV